MRKRSSGGEGEGDGRARCRVPGGGRWERGGGGRTTRPPGTRRLPASRCHSQQRAGLHLFQTNSKSGIQNLLRGAEHAPRRCSAPGPGARRPGGAARARTPHRRVVLSLVSFILSPPLALRRAVRMRLQQGASSRVSSSPLPRERELSFVGKTHGGPNQAHKSQLGPTPLPHRQRAQASTHKAHLSDLTPPHCGFAVGE